VEIHLNTIRVVTQLIKGEIRPETPHNKDLS
jgi:hypothetical protein